MDRQQKLEFYYKHLADLYRIACVRALLDWDLQVNMPPMGAEARGDQSEHMSMESHNRSLDPEFGGIVDELCGDLDSLSETDQTSVRLTKRALDIERKLPEDYVKELAQEEVLSFDAWVKARPANDFEAVKPHLEKLVALARRRSELLGYVEHPYDPLLDEYDPGAKTSIVKPILTDLGERLRELLPRILEKLGPAKELEGQFDKSTQNRLCHRISENLGFSFDSGRLDTAPHPFMTTLGPADFRITTRYDESDFTSALYGVIHETGHALYEMGLPPDYGKNPPMGSPMSLSLHESQSRLWENLIGRSREFSRYLSGIIPEFFPGNSLDADKIWKSVNRVGPSLIRVEADEVTYSLHVVIRMLLEEQLIVGSLSVEDLPDAWNDLYETYLGIRPHDYKDGVMQDMHWYTGSFGYFPTYALGNLYGAMMMETARKSIPDLSSQLEQGQFAPLLAWLRENVHRHGLRYYGTDLIRRITGDDLNAGPFVGYLEGKFLG